MKFWIWRLEIWPRYHHYGYRTVIFCNLRSKMLTNLWRTNLRQSCKVCFFFFNHFFIINYFSFLRRWWEIWKNGENNQRGVHISKFIFTDFYQLSFLGLALWKCKLDWNLDYCFDDPAPDSVHKIKQYGIVVFACRQNKIWKSEN